jgi:hypothetical protein
MVVNLADIVRRTNALSKSLFTRRISFVNRSEYKTPSCELQDLRRSERYPASRIGQSLEKGDTARAGAMSIRATLAK